MQSLILKFKTLIIFKWCGHVELFDLDMDLHWFQVNNLWKHTQGQIFHWTEVSYTYIQNLYVHTLALQKGDQIDGKGCH